MELYKRQLTIISLLSKKKDRVASVLLVYQLFLYSPGVIPVIRLKYCPINEGFGKFKK